MGAFSSDRVADEGGDEVMAMLEAMYLVAAADEHFSPEERRTFLGHATSLSEGKIGSEILVERLASWEARRQAGPIDGWLRELRLRLPDETSRRIAYGLCVEVADADGRYVDAEAAVLHSIAQAFGLESDMEAIEHSVRLSRPPR